MTQQDANNTDELIFIATSDIAARTKGRSMRLADFNENTSIGWVPANLGIGPLGHIVDNIPFGSSGDLRLLPDHDAVYRIDGVPDKPAFTVAFADLVETNGTPWEACPRTFLRNALQELRDDYGITSNATFEHEFVDLSATEDSHPFSFQSFRRLEPIGTQLMSILHHAGLQPENWLPEYAKHQYEVTVKPTDPVTAGDRAVLLREIVYELFDAHGREASFAPVVAPGSGGNGVHVHFSLNNLDGETLTFDPNRPGRLSELAGRFAAGIIKYAPALTALFAPLVTSYERLAPNNWSTARSFLGLQNREALLRICPTNEIAGRDPAPQLHFEFRASDIGANPWLLLGVIYRAGLQGLRENLDPEEVIVGDLDLEGEHRRLTQLPRSLNEALDLLKSNDVIRSWFPASFLETFIAVKHDENVFVQGRSLAEQCEVYSRVY